MVSVFRIIRGVIMIISWLLVGGEIRCICWVTVVGRVFKYQFSLSGTRLHVLLWGPRLIWWHGCTLTPQHFFRNSLWRGIDEWVISQTDNVSPRCVPYKTSWIIHFPVERRENLSFRTELHIMCHTAVHWADSKIILRSIYNIHKKCKIVSFGLIWRFKILLNL